MATVRNSWGGGEAGGARRVFARLAHAGGVARRLQRLPATVSPSLRRLASPALGALLAVAACHRSPVAGMAVPGSTDGGRDLGTAGAGGDGGGVDRTDATGAFDASSGDLEADAGGQGGVCPVDVLPVDVCGCGCCGPGAPGAKVCYYPALGDTREAIPDPTPTSSQCANVGCSSGVRHVCCADPGPDPAADGYCGADTTIEDLPRFTITRRDGAICTTLELSIGSGVNPEFAISTPPGLILTNTWRGTCGASPDAYAFGGLGSVSEPVRTLLAPLYDVHLALFFDAGTGIADAVRFDVDGLAILFGQACFASGGLDDGGAGDGGTSDDGGAGDGGGWDAGDGEDARDGGGCTPIPIPPGSCNFCSCTSMGVMICSERACPVGDAGLQ